MQLDGQVALLRIKPAQCPLFAGGPSRLAD